MGRKYHPVPPNSCRLHSAGSVCNLLRAVGKTDVHEKTASVGKGWSINSD